MFIPTINTGGREEPTPPLGLEAKSLKDGMTHHWISRDQTGHRGSDPHSKIMKQFLKIECFVLFSDHTNPLYLYNWFVGLFRANKSVKMAKFVHFIPKNRDFPY